MLLHTSNVVSTYLGLQAPKVSHLLIVNMILFPYQTETLVSASLQKLTCVYWLAMGGQTGSQVDAS